MYLCYNMHKQWAVPYARIEKNCARTKFFSGLSDDRANALMSRKI